MGTRTKRAQGSATDVMDRPARTRTASRETSATGAVKTRSSTQTRTNRGVQNTATRTVSPTRTTRREVPQITPTPRKSRLGSRQVVTERGRRVAPIKQVTLFSRLSAVAIALLIGGVVLAVWLSGVSTSQTFRIQQLTYQESQLNNQLETLNRDLEQVRSSADVARRGADAKMGIPSQPGIVEVGKDGTVEERRPATEGTEAIIDVNGEPVRTGRATSDPHDTEGVSDELNAVPRNQQQRVGDVDADDAVESRPTTEEESANAPLPAGENLDSPYQSGE
ncbi:hypothetical protein [Corynebacterium stationis]|uniref:hypothetical protein n=1 Tax=Corynebacterium stationis TaxID=1705 RepID=UPI00263A9280|nr:hypothetical protein [Corynebacterium stationis]